VRGIVKGRKGRKGRKGGKGGKAEKQKGKSVRVIPRPEGPA
jgi:hypothetical protein